MPNSDYFVIAYFACQAAGLIVLPVNTRLAPREIEYILNHSESKTLIYGGEFVNVVEELAPKISSVQGYIYVEADDNLRGTAFEDAITQGDGEYTYHPDEDDTTVIFYTLGTTSSRRVLCLPT